MYSFDLGDLEKVPGIPPSPHFGNYSLLHPTQLGDGGHLSECLWHVALCQTDNRDTSPV